MSLQDKLRGKRGIRFFGDVHGHFSAFAQMAADGINDGWHLHSLGDIIDKGPFSPESMALACDLADRGWLDLSPGNHCEKFMRWMQGRPVKLQKRGLATTVSQLAAHPDGKRIAERYFNLVAESKLWSRFGDLYAVHASFDKRMIGRDGPLVQAKDVPSSLRTRCLFGEATGEIGEDDFPIRSFDWIEEIPAGAIVLVGHTIFSLCEITERRNSVGGRLIHMDTGIQMNGKLSWLDIPAEVLLGEQPLDLPEFPAPGDRLTKVA